MCGALWRPSCSARFVIRALESLRCGALILLVCTGREQHLRSRPQCTRRPCQACGSEPFAAPRQVKANKGRSTGAPRPAPVFRAALVQDSATAANEDGSEACTGSLQRSGRRIPTAVTRCPLTDSCFSPTLADGLGGGREVRLNGGVHRNQIADRHGVSRRWPCREILGRLSCPGSHRHSGGIGGHHLERSAEQPRGMAGSHLITGMDVFVDPRPDLTRKALQSILRARTSRTA